MLKDLAYRRLGRMGIAVAPIACALALLAAATLPATAGTAKYTGAQPATISGGDIFTISGNTVTITGASTPTELNVNGAGNEQLLGVSGIWIVSPTGVSISGVSALSGDGTVTGTSPTTDWTAESGPAGYGGTTGYSPNGTWIDLVDSSTLTGDGKSASGFDSGTFDFSGLSSLSGYDFGIDYLIADGNGGTKTGRAYFSLPDSPPPGVPEPGSLTTLCLAGFGLIGLGLAARRRVLKTA